MQNPELRLMEKLQIAALKGRGIRLWKTSWTCYFHGKGEVLGRNDIETEEIFTSSGGY